MRIFEINQPLVEVKEEISVILILNGTHISTFIKKRNTLTNLYQTGKINYAVYQQGLVHLQELVVAFLSSNVFKEIEKEPKYRSDARHLNRIFKKFYNSLLNK